MELIEEYRSNLNKAKELSKSIEEYIQGAKKTRLFSKERRDYWKKISLLREELEENRIDIKRNYNEVLELSTFDSEFIVPLLIEHISNVEGEEYHLIRIKESDSDDYYYGGNGLEPPTIIRRYGYNFDIITTLENKEKLKNSEELKYLDNYLDLIKDNKYICLDDSKTQTLFEGLELSPTYSNYPYLKDFALDLMSKKVTKKR